ncbi:MAG: DUF1801 domain-containing protein [Thermoanaerobaculia bacterium]|nr:DUF1801 domain-containing protein [Thermoanaerobaculia bacterium]
MTKTPPPAPAEIEEVFAALPALAREKLLQVRSLIFDTAAKTPGVGRIEEALRWGEPSYLTTESRSGTTIRLHWKPRRPDCGAMYVHCQTDLLEQYRVLGHPDLELEGKRAVLFDLNKDVPVDALRDCISLALTYHLT